MHDVMMFLFSTLPIAPLINMAEIWLYILHKYQLRTAAKRKPLAAYSILKEGELGLVI